MDSDVIAHGGGWSDSGESILTGWASGGNEERRVWCLEKARSMPARCSSAMAVGGGRQQAEEGCVAGGGRRQTEEKGGVAGGGRRRNGPVVAVMSCGRTVVLESTSCGRVVMSGRRLSWRESGREDEPVVLDPVLTHNYAFGNGTCPSSLDFKRK
ncbi:galactose oxidase/kelch repeat superfamily protein [Striga asiatica]|uniref:Galactose oxidase/kelch repeat superfamily protein n=1 Tax=Striga asiatica TaxID=4170 RepID=A0A5A7P567_STRAF|nr:galactose oxidase/kelch repeat superfamily protein [Striga asiatica]